MSVWLRYLAIAVLVGNGFTALWNSIALGRMILQGPPALGIDRLSLNLAFSVAAIVLAILIAAPARQGVGLGTKMIAVPSVLGGGLGILSLVMWFYTRIDQPQISPTDRLAQDGLLPVVQTFIWEKAVQNAFFSACTLALAILVLASRRSSA